MRIKQNNEIAWYDNWLKRQETAPCHGGLLPGVTLSWMIFDRKGKPDTQLCFSLVTPLTWGNGCHRIQHVVHLGELEKGSISFFNTFWLDTQWAFLKLPPTHSFYPLPLLLCILMEGLPQWVPSQTYYPGVEVGYKTLPQWVYNDADSSTTCNTVLCSTWKTQLTNVNSAQLSLQMLSAQTKIETKMAI